MENRVVINFNWFSYALLILKSSGAWKVFVKRLANATRKWWDWSWKIRATATGGKYKLIYSIFYKFTIICTIINWWMTALGPTGTVVRGHVASESDSAHVNATIRRQSIIFHFYRCLYWSIRSQHIRFNSFIWFVQFVNWRFDLILRLFLTDQLLTKLPNFAYSTIDLRTAVRIVKAKVKNRNCATRNRVPSGQISGLNSAPPFRSSSRPTNRSLPWLGCPGKCPIVSRFYVHFLFVLFWWDEIKLDV